MDGYSPCGFTRMHGLRVYWASLRVHNPPENRQRLVSSGPSGRLLVHHVDDTERMDSSRVPVCVCTLQLPASWVPFVVVDNMGFGTKTRAEVDAQQQLPQDTSASFFSGQRALLSVDLFLTLNEKCLRIGLQGSHAVFGAYRAFFFLFATAFLAWAPLPFPPPFPVPFPSFATSIASIVAVPSVGIPLGTPSVPMEGRQGGCGCSCCPFSSTQASSTPRISALLCSNEKVDESMAARRRAKGSKRPQLS